MTKRPVCTPPTGTPVVIDAVRFPIRSRNPRSYLYRCGHRHRGGLVPTSPNNLSNMAVESYYLQESRLQRVEKEVNECSTQVALNNERLGTLKETVEAGLEKIAGQVSEVIPAIRESVLAMAARITLLEEIKKRKEARLVSLRNVVLAFSIALFGASAKILADLLFAHH